MMRQYSIPLLLAHCGLLALGCSQELEPSPETTAEWSAALLAADPPISDEIEIAEPKLERRTSVDPHIAFGDGVYLVVWSIPTTHPSAHMYGTRIGQSGEILDPSGFYIGPGYPSSMTHANGQFVVVSTPIMNNPNGEIRATRISPAGKVLDPGGVLVAPDDATSSVDIFPVIASDGTDFLIAWTENGNSPMIFRSLRTARFTGAGEVLDPGGKLVTEIVPWTNPPGLAFDGQQYLLTWSPNFDNIYGLRLSKAADVLDSKPIVIDELIGNHKHLKTLHDGMNFLVVSGLDDGQNNTIRIRKVASSGVVDPNAIVTPTGVGSAIFSDVSLHGQRLLVTLDDYTLDKTYSFHLTTDGIPSEPVPPVLAENSRDSRVAANAVGSLVIWAEEASYGAPAKGFTMGTRVDLAGKKLDSPALPVTVRASTQGAPRASFNGKNHFLAWREANEFLSAQVTPLGEVVPGPALPFKDPAAGSTQITQIFSAAEANGPVWAQATQIGATGSTLVARISADGMVLDSVPFQLPASSHGPLVTQQYLAAADSEGAIFVGASPSTSIPFAIRVTNDGAVQPLVQIGAQPCVPKSLTFDGTNYLLTCATPIGDYPDNDFDATLLGASISKNGQLLDAGWKPLFTFPNTMFEWFSASFDGKNHWLVWRIDDKQQGYWPNFPRTVRLHAMGVSSQGELLTPEPLLLAEMDGCGTAAIKSLHPAVGSVKDTTYVVWSESPNPASCDPFPIDLVGVTIDAAGNVSPKFPISSMPGNEDAPALSIHPEGQILVTYARFAPEAPYVAERARARFITACVCPDGQACVTGACSSSSSGSTSSGSSGGNNPGDEPIRFGGCGCRFGEEVPVRGGLATAMAMFVWAGLRRRSSRRRVM
jgi:hypothetical protein